MPDFKLLLDIIITFMKIDILSFGGGYVAIPIVEKQVVEINKWMTYSEFSNVLAIDELTPGPVAINCATFVGTRMAGTLGGICATIGCVLPSCILAILLIKIYLKYHGISILDGIVGGLRCMIVALLVSVTISLFKNAVIPSGNFDIIGFIIFGIALFVLRKYKIEPLYAILGSGAIGFLLYGVIK